VTRYGLDRWASKAGGGEFFRTCPDRPWCPPSLLYSGYNVSFPGVKRPGHGVYHPPPPSAKIKERYTYTSTLPLSLHGLFYGEHHIYLYHYGMFPLQQSSSCISSRGVPMQWAARLPLSLQSRSKFKKHRF
jgi:hypothetical protein